MWFSGFFFLILSLIVEVYLWWKLQASLIFLSGRTCTIGGWLNTFLPHCIYITFNWILNWTHISSTFPLGSTSRLLWPKKPLIGWSTGSLVSFISYFCIHTIFVWLGSPGKSWARLTPGYSLWHWDWTQLMWLPKGLVAKIQNEECFGTMNI